MIGGGRCTCAQQHAARELLAECFAATSAADRTAGARHDRRRPAARGAGQRGARHDGLRQCLGERLQRSPAGRRARRACRARRPSSAAPLPSTCACTRSEASASGEQARRPTIRRRDAEPVAHLAVHLHRRSRPRPRRAVPDRPPATACSHSRPARRARPTAPRPRAGRTAGSATRRSRSRSAQQDRRGCRWISLTSSITAAIARVEREAAVDVVGDLRDRLVRLARQRARRSGSPRRAPRPARARSARSG